MEEGLERVFFGTSSGSSRNVFELNKFFFFFLIVVGQSTLARIIFRGFDLESLAFKMSCVNFKRC